MNKGVRMGFWIDKVLLPLFIVALKTKRIAKSAVRGKLNYQAKKIFPHALGLLIAAWAMFVFMK
ncbi:hypothetical protein JXB27_02595 [Candidatus Woesearchaeota archaeon]|nr:hypothetical protein [Candidatus Woesearchaeota archaeon]